MILWVRLAHTVYEASLQLRRNSIEKQLKILFVRIQFGRGVSKLRKKRGGSWRWRLYIAVGNTNRTFIDIKLEIDNSKLAIIHFPPHDIQWKDTDHIGVVRMNRLVRIEDLCKDEFAALCQRLAMFSRIDTAVGAIEQQNVEVIFQIF